MAKVRAVIEADSGTLLVDFPQGIYALYEKLRSVGIRHSPSNIPIADEEDGAIRVKLYAEDDVSKRLDLFPRIIPRQRWTPLLRKNSCGDRITCLFSLHRLYGEAEKTSVILSK